MKLPDETVGAEDKPKGTWISLFDELKAVCIKRNVPMDVITVPERYQDHVNVNRRRNALRELHARGLTIQNIQTLCPLKIRYIERLIRFSDRPE